METSFYAQLTVGDVVVVKTKNEVFFFKHTEKAEFPLDCASTLIVDIPFPRTEVGGRSLCF